jgi:formiminotetrahydrofolate cyclodeaminase
VAERTTVAGPLTVLVTAEAASVVAAVARFSGDEPGAAQAESLRARVLPLAQVDAEAYAAAVERLARRTGDDFKLGRALEDAADVLLQIADAAADLVALAAFVAERAPPDVRPDAVAAAMLAEAAARAAVHLVEVNLAVASEDARSRRANATVAAAAAALQRTLVAVV